LCFQLVSPILTIPVSWLLDVIRDLQEWVTRFLR